MRRPHWWPGRWWPGGDEDATAGPSVTPAPARRSRSAGGDAAETFLWTLLEAFGSEGVALLGLDEEADRWVVIRKAVREKSAGGPSSELHAPGHPLTWCLREELIVQMPPDRVQGLDSPGGWCLAGPVPGNRCVLLWWFPGPPGPHARRALRPALEHLSLLMSSSTSKAGVEKSSDVLDTEDREDAGWGRTFDGGTGRP